MAYGTNESYVLADWSFGWDISTSPLDLDKRALSDCKNFNLTTRRGLEKRRGMTRMFTPASAGVVSDVFEYKAPDGTAYVLVATDTKIRSYYSGGWNDLVAGRTPGVRHSFAVHQGFCYGVNGVDPNFKLYNGTSYGVGIAPPLAAPGVADGGAGSLTGKYSYVYCYKRSSPNPLISNPSPASTPLDLTSKIFTVTYTPSLDPQVDTIIIYRTLNLNTQGTDPLAFFKVAEFAQAATAGGPPTGYLVTNEGFQPQLSDIPTITVDAGTEPPGDYILAASPELVDVEAAIALAVPGDIVVVPAGSATWAYQLVITKGILLIGAGRGNTVITSNYDAADYLIRYEPANPTLNEPFRLSGFDFDLGLKSYGLHLKNNSLTPINRVRIDHIKVHNARLVNGLAKGNLMYVYGTVYGVCDNSEIGYVRFMGMDEAAWANQTFEFGTADNLYFEDCICPFNGSYGGPYGEGAARYCFRYCTWTLAGDQYPAADMHGNQPTSHGATMGVEMYGNTYAAGPYGMTLMDQRGGKALVYNNSVTATTSTGRPKIREEHNDNLGPGPATGPGGQPQHVSDSYYWNNLRNGATLLTTYIGGTVDYGGEIGLVPQFDVDCWQQVVSFDGSTGVGVGLLSARPVTCTLIGAAYWATDVGTLYRWESPGQWEDYYSPYTYPHPLRSDPVLGD